MARDTDSNIQGVINDYRQHPKHYRVINGSLYKLIYVDGSWKTRLVVSGSSLTASQKAQLGLEPPEPYPLPPPVPPVAGGGGGGGLTKEDYFKMYKKVYWRIGINANESLMNTAYNKKIDNAGDFLLFVRRRDADYINSEPGRQKANALYQVWLEFFPNMKFNKNALRKFVSKNYTSDQMKDWLMRPSKKGGGLTRFQRLYPYFRDANTGTYLGGSLGTQLATYREYTMGTNMLFSRYYGRGASREEMETLFNRHLTPEQLEERIKTWGAASGSHTWMTGQNVDENMRNEFILNGPLSQQWLSKLTQAYNTQKSYFGSKPASFINNTNDTVGTQNL